MDASGEGPMKQIKEDKSDGYLLQKIDCYSTRAVGSPEGGSYCSAGQVQNGPGDDHPECEEHHDIAVVEELSCDVNLLNTLWKACRFSENGQIVPIEGFEGREVGKVDVQVVMVGQVKVGELKDAEEFEADYLAAGQARQEQNRIGDDLECE